MEITYRDTKNYIAKDLQDLFQPVGWLSANYPERLKKAIDNSETVFTAWDDGKLVGLINAIDDSELTAYVHYLCVDPAYQGQGIGKIMPGGDMYTNHMEFIEWARKYDTGSVDMRSRAKHVKFYTNIEDAIAGKDIIYTDSILDKAKEDLCYLLDMQL